MWRKGNPFALLVGMQTGAAVWRYLKKLKMDLLIDPVIPILGIYLKEPQTLIRKNISTLIFIAALFIQLPRYGSSPSVHQYMSG